MIKSKLFRSIHNHLNHITWFRNSASVSLFATLSHRTWIANYFSSFQLFQKRSKISDCTFWKNFYKRKFSFLFIFCTRNRHSTMIENYIKKNDVIKCELDLAFIEKLIQYLISQMTVDCCRERRKDVDKLSQIVATKHLINFHRLLSRNVIAEKVIIRSLKRREIEQICFC
jgi:hypothetical protein